MSSFNEDHLFSVRIVTADACLMNPVEGIDVKRSEFRQHKIDLVPVLRIFGSTPSGQSTCLYVHGIFPYLLIPYHGPEITEANREQVEQNVRQTAESLETALNGTSPKPRQRVFKISIVTATRFYGYYNSEDFFLKIFFYYPTDVKRAADILLAGGVMGRPFQPHEAHIPYVLQSFIDYNLHGMNLLHSANCWFRSPFGKPNTAVVLRSLDDDAKDKQPPVTSTTSATDVAKPTTTITAPSNVNLQNFDWNLMRNEGANVALNTQNTSEPNISQQHGMSSFSQSTPSKGTPENESENFQSTYCTPKCQATVSRIMSQSSASPTPPSGGLSCPLHRVWSSMSTDHILPSNVAERQSTCDLEVDIIAADIINRNELKRSDVTNPGIAAIWADEIARRGEDVKKNATQKRENVAKMTNKEAKHLQMLYDALDEHQASVLSTESSLDQSNMDLFHCSQANDPEVLSQTPRLSQRSDVTPTLSQPTQVMEQLTPIVSQDILSQVLSQKETNFEDEIVNLSVMSQHSNGFYDNDDDIPLNQQTNVAEDDDDLVTMEMSQRWDCDDIIPQYDGANDEEFVYQESDLCQSISPTKDEVSEEVQLILKFLVSKVVTDVENMTKENKTDDGVKISKGDITPVAISANQCFKREMKPVGLQNDCIPSIRSKVRPKQGKVIREDAPRILQNKNYDQGDTSVFSTTEQNKTEQISNPNVSGNISTSQQAPVNVEPTPTVSTKQDCAKSNEVSYNMRLRQTRHSADITSTIPASLLLASDSDSDCDFDISHVLHAPKATQKRVKKKKKKEKVIIKWIITNRFKGSSSMLVKLWKIPVVSTVPISNELLDLLELYSPKKMQFDTFNTNPAPNTSNSQLVLENGATNINPGANVIKPCEIVTTHIENVSSSSTSLQTTSDEIIDNKVSTPHSKDVDMTSSAMKTSNLHVIKHACKPPPPIPEKLLRRQIGKRSKNSIIISDNDTGGKESCQQVKPAIPHILKESINITPTASILELNNISNQSIIEISETSSQNDDISHTATYGIISLNLSNNVEDSSQPLHTNSDFYSFKNLETSANPISDAGRSSDVNISSLPIVPKHVPLPVPASNTFKDNTIESCLKQTATDGLNNTNNTVQLDKAIDTTTNVQSFPNQVINVHNHSAFYIPHHVQEKLDVISSIRPQSNSNNNNSHENEAKNTVQDDNKNLTDTNTATDELLNTEQHADQLDTKLPESGEIESNRISQEVKNDQNFAAVTGMSILEHAEPDKSIYEGAQASTCFQAGHEPLQQVVMDLEDDEKMDDNNNFVLPVEKLNCKVITEDLANVACNTLDLKLMERCKLKQAKKVIVKKPKRDGPNVMPVSSRTLEPCVRLEQLKQSDLNGMGVKGVLATAGSTQRKYMPTPKVTRRSVSVKLKALTAPSCMFPDPKTDECDDISVLDNALYSLAFNSPMPSPTKASQTPPRAWSPIIDHSIATSSGRSNSTVEDQTTLFNEFASSFENSANMLSSIDPDQMLGVNLDDIIAEESVQVELDKINKIKSEISSNLPSRSSSTSIQKTDLEIEEEAILQMFSDLPPAVLPSPAESSDISTIKDVLVSPTAIPVKDEVAPEPFVKLKRNESTDSRVETPWPEQTFMPQTFLPPAPPKSEYDISMSQNKPFPPNYFDVRFQTQSNPFPSAQNVENVLHKELYKGAYPQPAFDQKLYNENFVKPIEPVPVQVFHTHVHHHHHVHSIDKAMQKQSQSWKQQKPDAQWSGYNTPTSLPSKSDFYPPQTPFTAPKTPQYTQPVEKFNPPNIPELNFSVLMKMPCTYNPATKNKKRKASKKPAKKANNRSATKQPGPVSKKTKSPYSMVSKQKVLSKRIKANDSKVVRSPPPDTPTISLTNNVAVSSSAPTLPLVNKKESQKSDDVYAMYDLDVEKPSQTDNKGSLFKVILADSQSKKDESDDILQTFSFPIQDEDNSKKTVVEPPSVKKGEELVLNCVTGEWEVKKIANEEKLPDIKFDEVLTTSNSHKKEPGSIIEKVDVTQVESESTPEYEIAAVDMNSKLPKLKLKLKRPNSTSDKVEAKRSKPTEDKTQILLKIKQNRICTGETSDESNCGNSQTVGSETHSDSTESASECESELGAIKEQKCNEKNYEEIKTDKISTKLTSESLEIYPLNVSSSDIEASIPDTSKPPIEKVCLSKNPQSQKYEVLQAPKENKTTSILEIGSSKSGGKDKDHDKDTAPNEEDSGGKGKHNNPNNNLPPNHNPQFDKNSNKISNQTVSFKVSEKPPTREEIEVYVAENNETHSVPFYSNPDDAQKSNRLMDALPFYVHKPHAVQKFKNYKEYESAASRAGSLNHWRVVLTAEKKPEMLDQVLQIPESDITAKMFLEKVGNIALKVAKKPPSRTEVEDWLKEKQGTTQTKPDKNDKAEITLQQPQDNAQTPKMQKSLSLQPVINKLKVKRRRVSFDLSNINTPSQNTAIMDLSPVKGGNFSTPVGKGILLTPAKGVISTPSTFTNIAYQSTPKSIKKAVKHTPIKYDKEVLLDDQHTPSTSRTHQKDHKLRDLILETPQSSRKREGSQVEGPTFDNTFGFKAKQENLGEAKAVNDVQHLTVVSMEMHIQTRINLRPDPEIDSIQCIFYCVTRDVDYHNMTTGCFIVDADHKTRRPLLERCGVTSLQVKYVSDELTLFQEFVAFIRKLDPDILTGYEVQMLSWGYLLQRGQCLRVDVCGALSRVPSDRYGNRYDATKDVFGADNAHELHVVGRIILNIWRLMRTEVALYDYSFENVAFHVLHERYPRHDFKTLSNWYNPPSRHGNLPSTHRTRRVIDYYTSRVRGQLRMLTQQDLVGRTSELSRVFGILFYDVLTRGSQFRVESMLLRAAKSRNLAAVTPSRFQRAQMVAPEVIALVMEPESRFYHHPVVVLDFQSLYPSIVIAYNLCYSTCLGKVEHLGSNNTFTFGCTTHTVSRKTLRKLLHNNKISVMPNGVAYVKKCVRSGVMPDMLKEILDTRIMVKESMKVCLDGTTKRMLDHRQLGLKLIANVTYGYTAANYSGRMPCVELGDSIVHKSRETLERAIAMVIRNSKQWEGARVVYGDTDSMFIEFPGVKGQGCTKERAFEVGREIARVVTEDNPPPVKLKFEKVYLPCILQTKKRYVGYSYESEDQTEPIFDAKGIETVRRDGCPATSKILEKSLRLLFETRDVSKVKMYVMDQCSKILNSESVAQDCILAKEYRGKEYYRPNAVVPSLILARKQLALDRRSEPRVGERVPYLVRHGAPGTALYQLVTTVDEYMHNDSIRLNGVYYVTKQILPALDRMMSLLGEDVFQWYSKILRIVHHNVTNKHQNTTHKKGATLSQFFRSKHCILCKSLCKDTLCTVCVSHRNLQQTATRLRSEMRQHDRKCLNIDRICMSCTGFQDVDLKCTAYNCPITYKRKRVEVQNSRMDAIQQALLSNNLL